ncbi:uncharacterized protein [Dermacentor albipictus]|uniref:uncharacterized protein n=1 Tax=Dermacentor albipictus TaxID=60249 RepID=UPI0031FBCF88
MLSYLKKRIEDNQGIKVSKLPGHLAQLPPEVRAKYGGNEEAIRSFIQKHSEVFVIDKSDRVFLRPPPSPKDTAPPDVATDDAAALCNVTGKVLRVFPTFGFITTEHPIKTTVYFDVKSFEENRHTALTSSGLSEGDWVTFDATKSFGHKAAFKATCVKRIEMEAALPSSASQPTKEPSVDGDDRLHNESGIIHTVRPGFGFITFGPKKKNCAFFHGSVVDSALAKGRKNLTDILTTNDRVRFDAMPDNKGSKWCKWKATKVWCVPTEMDSKPNSKADSGDEVFMSEDEADIEGMLNDSSELDSSDEDVGDYPVGCPDWEDPPRMPLNPGDGSSAEQPMAWSARRKLAGIKGIFFKESEKAGHIFWLDGKVAARVVITIVYHMGRQIKSFDELPWNSDFELGVEAFFDAVKSDDTWIATLVWIGDRPPRLGVENSENIFNNILALATGETFTENKHIVATCRPVAPSTSEPSVDIYPDRKGVVVTAAKRMAWCQVREPSGCRQLKFTCLYRDGKVYTDCLDKVLQADDMVFVDYMVGTSHGREVVHCCLAWQGQKPLDVASFKPEDFVKLLNARAAEHSSASSSPEQPFPGRDVVLDGRQKNGHQSPSPNAYAEQMLGVAVGEEGAVVRQPRTTVPKQDDDTALNRILAHLSNAVRAGEGMPLARLQGILSQLPPSVRGRYGATVETIRLVARQFPSTIVVGSDGRVYTCAGPRASTKNDASMSHKPPDKKRLPSTKAGTTKPKQTGACAVLNASAEEVPRFPTARTAEPSVSIYPCVKGTVVQVLDCIATVRVKEAEGTRDIQFTNDCFFKDGEVVLDNLSEVLHEGDKVDLNYMVGSRGCKDDVVHCDLVWLGRQPDNVQCLGPDEFAKSLGIKAASIGVRASADDLRRQQQGALLESISGNHADSSVSRRTVPAELCHITENFASQPETDGADANQAAAGPSFERRPEQLVEEPQVVPTKSGLANAAAPFISPGHSDEILLRLARMVVQEFRAEFQEELQKCVGSLMKHSRIVVRDAESQTSMDDPRMSSTGESTPPFFSPCGTPTQELDVFGASPPRPDAVVSQPLELQEVQHADNTAAHTSCEQYDKSTSQPPVQVQSGNMVDMAKTSDQACNNKPVDAKPEGTIASQPLELQQATPVDSTAAHTSCEQDDNSTSQPSVQVQSGNMVDLVEASDEARDNEAVDAKPEGTIASQSLELEKATPADSTAVHTSCERDDKSTSQRPTQVQSGNMVDMAESPDHACDTKPLDAEPEGTIPFQPLEVQKSTPADNTAAHTSCEQDDKSTSQPPVQVQSGNMVDLVETFDEACDNKPVDAKPEGTIASQSLELQKATPADSTAVHTSCEWDDKSTSQRPTQVQSGNMVDMAESPDQACDTKPLDAEPEGTIPFQPLEVQKSTPADNTAAHTSREQDDKSTSQPPIQVQSGNMVDLVETFDEACDNKPVDAKPEGTIASQSLELQKATPADSTAVHTSCEWDDKSTSQRPTQVQSGNMVDMAESPDQACDTKPLDAEPEGTIPFQPLEVQKSTPADNTAAHTSREQDDKSTSQPPIQVQSGNMVDLVETSDEACDNKPVDAKPETTITSQPLELQQAPADNTASDTSPEVYGNSLAYPPEPVRSGSMADMVSSSSNGTAGVSSAISQPFEALVTQDSHVEELAVHIGTAALEVLDKSCTVSELSNLSEAADGAPLSFAESHNVLLQNGTSGRLLTENKELGLSGKPEESPIDAIVLQATEN